MTKEKEKHKCKRVEFKNGEFTNEYQYIYFVEIVSNEYGMIY